MLSALCIFMKHSLQMLWWWFQLHFLWYCLVYRGMPLAKWVLHLALLYLYGFVVLEELAYTIWVYMDQQLLRHLILSTLFIILGGILFRLGCPLAGVFYVQQVMTIPCWSIISRVPNCFFYCCCCLSRFADLFTTDFFKATKILICNSTFVQNFFLDMCVKNIYVTSFQETHF